jgi:hypothetical protein
MPAGVFSTSIVMTRWMTMTPMINTSITALVRQEFISSLLGCVVLVAALLW